MTLLQDVMQYILSKVDLVLAYRWPITICARDRLLIIKARETSIHVRARFDNRTGVFPLANDTERIVHSIWRVSDEGGRKAREAPALGVSGSRPVGKWTGAGERTRGTPVFYHVPPFPRHFEPPLEQVEPASLYSRRDGKYNRQPRPWIFNIGKGAQLNSPKSTVRPSLNLHLYPGSRECELSSGHCNSGPRQFGNTRQVKRRLVKNVN